MHFSMILVPHSVGFTHTLTFCAIIAPEHSFANLLVFLAPQVTIDFAVLAIREAACARSAASVSAAACHRPG